MKRIVTFIFATLMLIAWATATVNAQFARPDRPETVQGASSAPAAPSSPVEKVSKPPESPKPQCADIDEVAGKYEKMIGTLRSERDKALEEVNSLWLVLIGLFLVFGVVIGVLVFRLFLRKRPVSGTVAKKAAAPLVVLAILAAAAATAPAQTVSVAKVTSTSDKILRKDTSATPQTFTHRLELRGTGFNPTGAKLLAVAVSPATGVAVSNAKLSNTKFAGDVFAGDVSVAPTAAVDQWYDILFTFDGGSVVRVKDAFFVPSSTTVGYQEVFDTRYSRNGHNSNGNGDLSRSLIHGLCEFYGVDEAKFTALLRSPKSGTSKEAVTMLESARQNATISAVVKDDRLLDAIADKAAQGIKLYFKDNPITAPSATISDDRIREVAGDVVEPVRAAVVEMGGLSAKVAEQVAVLGNSQVTDTRSRLLGIGKKTEHHPVNPAVAAQASDLAAQIRAAQEKARTGK
ncbi:MAG: hypothetical protein M1383_03120 [Patescibacteria group bacterium]|nr:hypothetical protein [Patescibacteria group bacterium]